MSFIFGLLIVVLFLKLFVGISVGLFKLLMGAVVILAVLALLPIGIAVLTFFIPIIIVFSIIGFALKVLF